MTNAEAMMYFVWNNPDDETAILAYADAVAEEWPGWSYDESLNHARYHARRSKQYRDFWKTRAAPGYHEEG